MALKIDQGSAYFYPVAVEMIGDDGKFSKMTFEAEFKRLPRPQVESMMKRMAAGDLSDYEVCCEVLVGWKAVLDESDEPIKYSDEMRDRVLNTHPVCPSVVRAWGESLNPKGKAKN
jgi:hypothetical protein